MAVLSTSSTTQTHGEVVMVAWWPNVDLAASLDGGWGWSFGMQIPNSTLVTTRVATLVVRIVMTSTPMEITQNDGREAMEFGT